MSVDSQAFHLWGVKALVPLAVITVIGAMIYGLRSGRGPGLGVVGPLVTSLVIMLALLFILGMAIGIRPQRMVSGMTKAGGALARGAATAASRSATAGARTLGRASTAGSVSVQYVTVRRFRVQSALGLTQSCVMAGDLNGDELRAGDLVRVHGRVARAGHRITRRVEVLDAVDGPARSVVVSSKPSTLRLARGLDLLARVLTVVLVVADAGLVWTIVR